MRGLGRGRRRSGRRGASWVGRESLGGASRERRVERNRRLRRKRNRLWGEQRRGEPLVAAAGGGDLALPLLLHLSLPTFFFYPPLYTHFIKKVLIVVVWSSQVEPIFCWSTFIGGFHSDFFPSNLIIILVKNIVAPHFLAQV